MEICDMQDNKVAVFCFGRFNPVTKGHVLQFENMLQTLGDYIIFTSFSHDGDKNPLPHDVKITMLRKAIEFGNIDEVADIEVLGAVSPFTALEDLAILGYNKAVYYHGSDYSDDSMLSRLKQYANKLGIELDTKESGLREDGMSASALRLSVSNRDVAEYRRIVADMSESDKDYFWSQLTEVIPNEQ